MLRANLTGNKVTLWHCSSMHYIKKPTGKYGYNFNYVRFVFEQQKLQWSDVGVYKFSKISETETFEINKKEVFGKCVIIDEVLVSAPKNILSKK